MTVNPTNAKRFMVSYRLFAEDVAPTKVYLSGSGGATSAGRQRD